MRDGGADPIRVLIFNSRDAGAIEAPSADVEIMLLPGEADAATVAHAFETIASRIRARLADGAGADGQPAGRSADASGRSYEPLSERQRMIVALISEGCTNREIASRVHLSENTVKSHIQEIFRKLGVRTRVEAAIRAAREGLF
jgi:DNA-binding NarL/FixJ family response regulator